MTAQIRYDDDFFLSKIFSPTDRLYSSSGRMSSNGDVKRSRHVAFNSCSYTYGVSVTTPPCYTEELNYVAIFRSRSEL